MLKLSHISKSFKGRKVLDDVNMEFAGGRITALLGANGSGKTTTFRIILNLLPPDSGTALYEAGPLLPCQSGYVPEQCSLFTDCTIDSQLKLFGRLKGMEEDLLEMRISQWLQTMDLVSRRYQPIGLLSKGNRQRVAMIEALMTDPMVLICDEPFNGLDQASVSQLQQLLKKLADRGKTIILSFHQYEAVGSLADDFYYLRNGQVALTASRQSMLTDSRRILEIETAAADFCLKDDAIISVHCSQQRQRYQIADRTAALRLWEQVRDYDFIQSIRLQPLTITDLLEPLLA